MLDVGIVGYHHYSIPSGTDRKQLCLTLTRSSAFVASADLGCISDIIINHYHLYYYYHTNVGIICLLLLLGFIKLYVLQYVRQDFWQLNSQ